VEDKHLEALTQAEFYWRKSFYEGRLTKLAYAEDLHRYGVFSLTQIAKCVRMHTAELGRYGLTRNGKGGRFEPEALSALIQLRKQKLRDETVSNAMVKTAIDSGTSWACISYLCGIAYSNYYTSGGAPLASRIRAQVLKTTEKQAIVIALRAGANAALLAEQYNITAAYVMEISRAHANV
jgi:hypothetical protein